MTAIAGTPKLLKQEVEYLRTEVERLQAESEAFRGKLAEQCGQTLVARAEVARLEAALQRIADMCPATAELTLAHEMADNAMAALEPKP
jgi:uncharacterized small protein (DUF1192 family)